MGPSFLETAIWAADGGSARAGFLVETCISCDSAVSRRQIYEFAEGSRQELYFPEAASVYLWSHIHIGVSKNGGSKIGTNVL